MNPLKLMFSKKMIKGLPDLFFKYIPIYIYTSFKQRPKQLWIVCERENDARDNGYFLYKWLRDNYPKLGVYYAINTKSKDYNKVKGLGNIVEWGSIKHYYILLSASILCSTDFGLCAPNSRFVKALKSIMPVKGKKVFLQHGITKDNIRHGHQDKMGVSLFVCGAYPEWKYINKNFGYTHNEAKYIGFARFDNLLNTTKKSQILYMPTWRFWLREEGGFDKSDYYKTLCEFLSSDKLKELLDITETEFIFFLHPAMREKKYLFKEFEGENIKIMNNDDLDLQILLKSCSLLITDYSSIYFDIAYLGKPVIYYQFDVEEYRKKQYAEGYFSYERDGFGPIIKTKEELIIYLGDIISKGFDNPDEYVKRAERFFPIRDKNNCLRHFEELCKLDNI